MHMTRITRTAIVILIVAGIRCPSLGIGDPAAEEAHKIRLIHALARLEGPDPDGFRALPHAVDALDQGVKIIAEPVLAEIPGIGIGSFAAGYGSYGAAIVITVQEHLCRHIFAVFIFQVCSSHVLESILRVGTSCTASFFDPEPGNRTFTGGTLPFGLTDDPLRRLLKTLLRTVGFKNAGVRLFP